MGEDAAGLEREFDMLAARAGLLIPADRRHEILASFVELRRQAALLRSGRPAAAEPANVYDVSTILRADLP